MRLAVIVGNGFSIDCAHQLELRDLDLNAPLSWPLRLPQQPNLALRDALPHFFPAFDSLHGENPSASQFQVLRQIIGPESDGSDKAEIEARHFLSLSYRWLSGEFFIQSLEDWRWLHWFTRYRSALLTTVSFNYDCLLEQILHMSGRLYTREHNVPDDVVQVFKPHGSSDFDIDLPLEVQLRYPLAVHASRNNTQLRIVPQDEWHLPPLEPLIVLPLEETPFAHMQWTAPGYRRFEHLAPALTHCVFIGLSYHEADRPEIDHFLHSTSMSCRIIIANPTPRDESALLNAAATSGRPFRYWPNGPEDLSV